MVIVFRYFLLFLFVLVGWITAFEISISLSQYEDMGEIKQYVWEYFLKEPYMRLPNTDAFTMHERRHLLDIKRILQNVQILWVVSFLSILILLFYFKNSLAKTLNFISKKAIYITLGISILGSINFIYIFDRFHTLFFIKGSWYFDKESLLVQLFPLEYFQYFFMVSVFFSLVIFTIFYIFTRKKEQKI